MKVFVGIGLFAALIAVAAALRLGTVNNGARVCRINLPSCNTNNNVCGRLGLSNICVRFNNLCGLQIANCQAQVTARYSLANLAFCSNIALNTQGICSTTTGIGAGVIGGTVGNGGTVVNGVTGIGG